MMQARIRHPQEKRRSPRDALPGGLGRTARCRRAACWMPCDALPGGLGRTAPISETVMAPFVVLCMKAG